ncbi:MAG: hypothetical protein NTY02_06350 [Acidobacteria bacterium]|nr:hypothetical protein [Acidobacteriota bacterium]
MSDTHQPAAPSTAPLDRASEEVPPYRPRDQFWPYADLQEEPSDEELARLDPDLQAALYENPPERPFSYTIAFGPFDGPNYESAVRLAKDTSDYLETGTGPSVCHRARFLPDQVLALRDLWHLVGGLHTSEVLVDDRPVPYARELWLPLLWYLLPR